ncbi:E2-like enzyme [Ceratobasidium sp. 414]|nr:E2-like enzyme [Ceratobasidium sp. 414]
MPMLSRYPHQRRNLMRFGVLLCSVSLLGAAFATQSRYTAILYFPVQVYLIEWFDKRRGLANGVIFSGTGLGGVILPFIVETLLNRYGLKTTFISLRTDWSFAWDPQFLVLFIGNFLQGLGNFVPGIWLPSHVTSGTLIVSLMNGKYPFTEYDLRGVMLTSMLGSSLAVLVLWGLASNLALLLVFALMYGFLAGGFSALWPKFASTVAKDDPHSNARLISLFIAGRGIGNVLAAPISSSLLRSTFSSGKHVYGLKNYGPLIAFTGVALFSSTVGIFYKNVERMVNRGGSRSLQLNPSHQHSETKETGACMQSRGGYLARFITENLGSFPIKGHRETPFSSRGSPPASRVVKHRGSAMNSLHAIQSHYWAVRDYLSPVSDNSSDAGGVSLNESLWLLGTFLRTSSQFGNGEEKGEPSKARDYLPADKQYLVTRKVPCLRRATSLAYTDADEDAEKLLSFADDSGKGDEWVQTHAGRPADDASKPREIHDIPDIDGHAHELTRGMNSLSIEPAAPPDLDDIPDMEEEGLEEVADEATAKPTPAPPVEIAKGNLLQVRTYDVMITYDKYYQTPRIWLLGFDENGTPLTPPQVFQDVSADHAFKTVTIEPFPHAANLSAASVHPCKHASVMKKVIERMNTGVVEEQKKRQAASGSSSSGTGGKRKWLGLRKGSTSTSAPDESKKGSGLGPGGEEGAEETEGMRVDFYLVVFLKFIASIVPTIEVDSTTAF